MWLIAFEFASFSKWVKDPPGYMSIPCIFLPLESKHNTERLFMKGGQKSKFVQFDLTTYDTKWYISFTVVYSLYNLI